MFSLLRIRVIRKESFKYKHLIEKKRNNVKAKGHYHCMHFAFANPGGCNHVHPLPGCSEGDHSNR